MIVDNLKNASCYFCLGEKFEKAFKFLQENDLLNFENGKYEIDGDDVYVMVQDYTSRKIDAAQFEAHKKFVDIQVVLKGQERMGYADLETFKATCEYDESKDLVFGDATCSSLVLVEPKDFVIFMPQDAHMPGLCVEKPYYVKKAVVKIKI